MFAVLVLIATLLAIWRYTLWYKLKWPVPLFSLATVLTTAIIYLANNECPCPVFPLAAVSAVVFAELVNMKGLTLKPTVLFTVALLGTWAHITTTQCHLLFGGLAMANACIIVYTSPGGVSRRKS